MKAVNGYLKEQNNWLKRLHSAAEEAASEDMPEFPRVKFDYTEWQRNLYKDVPLDELLKNAMEFRIMNNENTEVTL